MAGKARLAVLVVAVLVVVFLVAAAVRFVRRQVPISFGRGSS